MQRIISAFIGIMLMGCAAINSPTGGEKDTEAPEVLSMHPENASTNFDASKFSIRFNEFIAREDFSKKLIISPPVGDDFKVIYRGKKLIFQLPDSLTPNTTYSFQFGNSIKDYTEGNSLNNFQYVFSTGPALDSLKLAGHVINASNGLPVENAWVLLYDQSENTDSLLFDTSAKYITQTDASGAFHFDYLADNGYHLFALVDQNNDLRYQSKHELAGFYTGVIYPDTLASPEIAIFQESEKFKFLGARYSQYGRLDIKFQGNVDPYEVVLEQPQIHYETWNSSVDSSSIWFNPEGVDSVLTFVESSGGIDTVNSKILPFKKRSFKLDVLKEVYHLEEPISISSVMPFELLDSSKIILVNQSLDTIPHSLLGLDGRGYELNFKKSAGEAYNLFVYPNSFSSYLDEANDSLQFAFKINPKSAYSSIVLSVDSILASNPGILQLSTSKGALVRSVLVERGQTKIILDYLLPGEYTLQWVVDSNDNERWDAGNIAAKIQPEKVHRHNGVLKLKANWVVDIDFQSSKLNLSPSAKKGNLSR